MSFAVAVGVDYSRRMAYPEHWLFSFGGTIVGGKEIWSNNIRFAVPEGSTQGLVDEGDMLDDLMGDLSAQFGKGTTTGGLGYSSAVTLRWGKFNAIGPDGRYVDQNNTRVLDLPTPVVGVGVPVGNLPQAALAVSWGTDRSRGAGARGRIYIPMPAVSVEVNVGAIRDGSPANIATNWANLLEKFNDWQGAPDPTEMIACVVSNVGSGVKEPIRTVRVGDVVDTMRSRRNALQEVYVEATVPDVDV